jgi:hypothetical protein
VEYRFPFGEPLRRVEQPIDGRSPGKKVFVLGVYSSAVHARWLDEDGRELVKALAVASEPSIFWRGEGCAEMIASIQIPAGCGSLEPADGDYNGPSSARLDSDILEPLGGITRADAWLCDLLPESRANCQQLAAIYREYVPRMKQFKLPVPTVPVEPDFKRAKIPSSRLDEILLELAASDASLLVLLGDIPISAFLRPLGGRQSSLRDFGDSPSKYGKRHRIQLRGIRPDLEVLPLAHPRQIGGLGGHSPKWKTLHSSWKAAQASARGKPNDC